jgi:hypothetical protein
MSSTSLDQEGQPEQRSQGDLAAPRVSIPRIRQLLLAVIIGTLLLSGGTFDRSLIDMPAWQHVGALAWATFSQFADLGSGLLIYPVQGIGSTVLLLSAALIVFLNRKTLGRAVALPVYVALLCALGVMVTTTQAAPAMLSASAHLNDPAALQHALETFTLWQGIRTVFGFLATCALIWALVAIASSAASSAARSSTNRR